LRGTVYQKQKESGVRKMSIETLIIGHLIFGVVYALLNVRLAEFKPEYNQWLKSRGIAPGGFLPLKVAFSLEIIIVVLMGVLNIPYRSYRMYQAYKIKKQPIWTLLDPNGLLIQNELSHDECVELGNRLGKLWNELGKPVNSLVVDVKERTMQVQYVEQGEAEENDQSD
jgi:hypothetical protein